MFQRQVLIDHNQQGADLFSPVHDRSGQANVALGVLLVAFRWRQQTFLDLAD